MDRFLGEISPLGFSHAAPYCSRLAAGVRIVELIDRANAWADHLKWIKCAMPAWLEKITAIERQEIALQLGRKPKNVLGISAYCCADAAGQHIAVITSYPLDDAKPSQACQTKQLIPCPNLYWLTCPKISKAIANLERLGAIKQIELLVKNDPSLAKQLLADHQRYIENRWALLTQADRQWIAAAELARLYQTRGIGGIQHFLSLKCLHAHYAQHLADANCIGRILEEQYHIRRCQG